jgi:hypothetical protein
MRSALSGPAARIQLLFVHGRRASSESWTLTRNPKRML